VYPPLLHAEWNGCTPTDLIFPFFLFIMGVSVPFSFGKRLARGDSRKALFRHILRRSVILFGLGLFMAAFPRFDLLNIRIMGVLQRIGVVYLAAASGFLVLGRKGRGLMLAGILLGYWALMTLVPVPGYGAGNLSPEGNLGAFLDRLILGDHLWREMWDPEGLLSTLPAIGTTLLGIFAGEWIRGEGRRNRVVAGLLAAGAAGLVLGWAWGLAFPINKSIWTSSYVLFTAGAAAWVLGIMFWLMEVRGWTSWARPMVVYGMNAIAVFVASGLMARLLGIIRVGEADTSLKGWLYENLFATWAGPLNGSLAFALTYVLFWLGLMWLLHRRGIFIKV
jgi:predicted acyltransferase